MVRAGYDPMESPKIFEHLKVELEEQDVSEPFFFGTHPRVEERIENYHDLLQDVYSIHEGATYKERFERTMLPLILKNAELDLSMGRFSLAEQAASRVLKIDPNQSKAHFMLGEVYRKRGKIEEVNQAIQAYQRAVTADPTFADPHKPMGLLYFKRGNVKAAEQEWRDYLRLAPHSPGRSHVEYQLQALQDEKNDIQ